MSEHAAGGWDRSCCHGGADKNFGYSFVLSNTLGCVNSRQEGKLTDRVGNGNGNAKGMSRLRVFFAIHDKYVFLPGGNLVW